VRRLLWGCLGAVVGSYLGIVVTVVFVLLPPAFRPRIPFSHALALLFLWGVPTIFVALFGFAFPDRARSLGADFVGVWARMYRSNRRRRS
jgi:hypothetical protein